ncbi:MAG TPA: hypothetical protein VFX11_08785 [Candidatus Kapabacteria bacterium]|nr:hypothetical protein [Candidatus Kapabacteria bacterium]
MQMETTKQPAVQELDLEECRQVGGGNLSPDQDISDFPVIALPRINVAINAKLAKVAVLG